MFTLFSILILTAAISETVRSRRRKTSHLAEYLG